MSIPPRPSNIRRWLSRLPQLWILLAVIGFVPPAAFAYDAQNQARCAYDSNRRVADDYDAVPVLTTDERESATTAGRLASAQFAEFLAAETAGLEARGLRPLPGTRQIPEGIPDGWRIRPTQGEGGTWYYDPANKGNAVRVMQGDPASPFPNSQSPYVRWQQNGQALDINGNVVLKNTPDAHIPLQDFKFNPDLFK